MGAHAGEGGRGGEALKTLPVAKMPQSTKVGLRPLLFLSRVQVLGLSLRFRKGLGFWFQGLGVRGLGV